MDTRYVSILETMTPIWTMTNTRSQSYEALFHVIVGKSLTQIAQQPNKHLRLIIEMLLQLFQIDFMSLLRFS